MLFRESYVDAVRLTLHRLGLDDPRKRVRLGRQRQSRQTHCAELTPQKYTPSLVLSVASLPGRYDPPWIPADNLAKIWRKSGRPNKVRLRRSVRGSYSCPTSFIAMFCTASWSSFCVRYIWQCQLTVSVRGYRDVPRCAGSWLIVSSGWAATLGRNGTKATHGRSAPIRSLPAESGTTQKSRCRGMTR